MSTYRCSVNVVARHPTRPAEEIASALGWEPYNAWSAGDARITPAGTKLPGIRQETMCAFRFEFDDDGLSTAVNEKVDQLLTAHDIVKELLGSGGSLSLNIGLNGQFNSSFELPPEMLRAIGELGIQLSVECFPNG